MFVKIIVELHDEKECVKRTVLQLQGKLSYLVNFYYAAVQHLRGWNMKEGA